MLFPDEGIRDIKKVSPDWNIKQKEIRDRLLAIPILLYHNIDGKGPFSISYSVLRDHFSLFKKSGVEVIPLRELVLRLKNPRPFQEKVIVLTFDDGYDSMYTKLMPLAKEFNYPVTLFVYTDRISKSGGKSLNWQKLREMEKNGISIESHTIFHRDLVKLNNTASSGFKQLLFEEIYLSKRVLELYLNKSIDYFAFPYGSYDLYIIDLCQNAGYDRVFSTDYGPNILTRNNYCLRRRHIKSNYTLEMMQRLIN